jgi:hypothetical protein
MADLIPLVVHATHEAGVKVGGIGAVLDGLLGRQQLRRTGQAHHCGGGR